MRPVIIIAEKIEDPVKVITRKNAVRNTDSRSLRLSAINWSKSSILPDRAAADNAVVRKSSRNTPIEKINFFR